jgi:hypothetical protein
LITWNWGFQTGIPSFGSGTFTTADPPPAVAGTIYTITSIAGTYTQDGTTYGITGLDSDTNNTFKWDGTSFFPIISTYDGISFRSDSTDSAIVYIYCTTSFCKDNAGFGAIDKALTDIDGADGSVTLSSLMPAQAPAPAGVPGPLPVFGVATAFGWSRQLRRRIKTPA